MSSRFPRGAQRRSHPQESMWYAEDGLESELEVRVTGMNLQGSGKSSGLFFKTELQQTVFQMLVSFHGYSWSVFRSFDAFKDFYYFLRDDSTLGPQRLKLLKSHFPPGNEGEDDVMVLVERREAMDEIIREAVALLNIHYYEPLSQFLNAAPHLAEVRGRLRVLGRSIKKYAARRKHYMRLFKFYSKDMMRFSFLMEGGINVFCVAASITDGNNSNNELHRATSDDNLEGIGCGRSISGSAIPQEYVLWLDVCEEAALSRLCVAPRSVFELPRDCEDERLSTGIFLSDIAEIRHGLASHGFKQSASSGQCAWLKPHLCVSVVGSERTIDFQLMDESEVMKRSFFIDTLNLLALQTLNPLELKLRHRHFQRSAPHKSVQLEKRKLTRKETQDAERLQKLLIKGIEVDEEAYSPYYGVTTLAKHLSYKPEERKLLINAISHPHTESSPVQPSTAVVEASSLSGADDDGCTSGANSVRNSSFSGLPPNHASGTIHQQPLQQQQQQQQQQPAGGYLGNLLNSITSSNRSILIDDISEIRPGKISSSVDGSDDATCLSIIASETILIMPTDSTRMRDILIRRFQAFVHRLRDTEALYGDLPVAFQPEGGWVGHATAAGQCIEQEGSEKGATTSASAAKHVQKGGNMSILRGAIEHPSFSATASSGPGSGSSPQGSSMIFSHYKAARSVSHIRRSSHTSLRGSSMSGGGSFDEDGMQRQHSRQFSTGGSGKAPRLLSMDENDEV